MAKETISDEQKQEAEAKEKECEAARAQLDQQKAEEELKKAKEQLDKVGQQLSEVPEKAIGGLMDAIDLLMSIVNGHVNVNSPTFDPAAIIAQIMALLNPVLSALGSLPVPAIPGLAQLGALLGALNALLAPSPDSSGAEPPSVEIPPEIMTTLNNLLNTLLSICQTLPLVLINLIFQMLNIIIGLFKQIAGIIGVPPIPFPLSLAPTCISMMPDIMSFMTQVPGKMFDVAYATLKKAFGKITSLQLPSPPSNIEIPKSLSKCLSHAAEEEKTDDPDNFTEEDKANARALLKEWYGE